MFEVIIMTSQVWSDWSID